MSLSGFTPVNQPSTEAGPSTAGPSRAETAATTMPQNVTKRTPVPPRTSSRHKKQQLERVFNATTIFDPGFIKLKETHGIVPVLSGIMEDQKTPEARSAMYRGMTGMGEVAQDMVDEYTEAVWGPVATNADIWKDVGGEEAYKAEVGYANRVEPRRALYQMSNTRKANARVTLKGLWGEDWEEEFDPRQKRLQNPAECVLQGIAAMGREGWPKRVVWLGMDMAFRVRFQEYQERKPISNNFVTEDARRCKTWLEKVGVSSGKEKAEVGLAELMKVLPEEMRAQEAQRAAKGKQQAAAARAAAPGPKPLRSRPPTQGPGSSPPSPPVLNSRTLSPRLRTVTPETPPPAQAPLPESNRSPRVPSPPSSPVLDSRTLSPRLRTVTPETPSPAQAPLPEPNTLPRVPSPAAQNKAEEEPVLVHDLKDPSYRFFWDLQNQSLVSTGMNFPTKPVRLGQGVKNLWEWGFDRKRFAVDLEAGKLVRLGEEEGAGEEAREPEQVERCARQSQSPQPLTSTQSKKRKTIPWGV